MMRSRRRARATVRACKTARACYTPPSRPPESLAMKQSPIRRLRRDRSRQVQELSLAKGTGDVARAKEIEAAIKALDREIAAIEAGRGEKD